MSQLYLYSNIWIYIWSVFSRVGTYFTYLIHNEASPVCGNYLPCETQCGDRGALREGLSRPLGLLTKTWLVVCTPPFISIISEIVVGWLFPTTVGKLWIGRFLSLRYGIGRSKDASDSCFDWAHCDIRPAVNRNSCCLNCQ